MAGEKPNIRELITELLTPEHATAFFAYVQELKATEKNAAALEESITRVLCAYVRSDVVVRWIVSDELGSKY